MSKTKGYVVQGKARVTERPFWMSAPPEIVGWMVVGKREEATEFVTLAAAVEAAMQMSTCRHVRIFAVAADGAETPLPSYEEALAAHQRTSQVLDDIAVIMRSMSLRPRMYGDALAVEMQAHAYTEIRRTLLGAPSDERLGPGKADGVYPRLHRQRFGVSSCTAASLVGVDEVADVEIGDFVGEWWRREQEAVPDPERDARAEEERLAAARARIAALPGPAREKARDRMRVSWDRADYAVQHYGCALDGNEVVWPDGDRWLRSARSQHR